MESVNIGAHTNFWNTVRFFSRLQNGVRSFDFNYSEAKKLLQYFIRDLNTLT